MRNALAGVGMAFALGFLALPFVGPPSPNAGWVTPLCVGFCLCVAGAGFEGRGGRACRWTLGVSVTALAGWAFVAKLTEPDPRPWAERWDWPWGWVRVLTLALVFAGSAALQDRRRRRLSIVSLPESWWETMTLDTEIEEARPEGIVYARRREYGDREDAEETRRLFAREHSLDAVASVGFDEARAFAIRAMTRNQDDGREVLDEATARSLVDAFLSESAEGHPPVRAWTGQGPWSAGILVETEVSGAELVVDDRLWEA